MFTNTLIDAHYNRALAYTHTGRYALALEDMNIVIDYVESGKEAISNDEKADLYLFRGHLKMTMAGDDSFIKSYLENH